jgi:hypothetical protein
MMASGNQTLKFPHKFTVPKLAAEIDVQSTLVFTQLSPMFDGVY